MDKDSIRKRVEDTIRAEITAVSRLKDIVTDEFYAVHTILSDRKGKIVVTGVGKSGIIAMKMTATLNSLGHQSSFLNPLDALHGDSGIVSDGDVVVAFSFSGSSPELSKLIKHFKEYFSINLVLVTGNRDSALASLADATICINVEEEGCPLGLAPMASTTASLVVADAIASSLTSPEVFKPEHFAKFHPAGSLGLTLQKVEEIMREGEELPRVTIGTIFEDVLKEITRQEKTQIVGVVDSDGCLVGAIADGDIRRLLMKYGDLRGKKIEVLMNKNPKTIIQSENLQSALHTMTEHKINNLFVIDETNKYIGFIHMHDILT